MFLDVPKSVPLVTNPLCGIIPAQLLHKVLSGFVYLPRELYHIHSPQYKVVGLHGIRPGKRRRTGEQLEHEDTQRPVVGRQVVTLRNTGPR